MFPVNGITSIVQLINVNNELFFFTIPEREKVIAFEHLCFFLLDRFNHRLVNISLKFITIIISSGCRPGDNDFITSVEQGLLAVLIKEVPKMNISPIPESRT